MAKLTPYACEFILGDRDGVPVSETRTLLILRDAVSAAVLDDYTPDTVRQGMSRLVANLSSLLAGLYTSRITAEADRPAGDWRITFYGARNERLHDVVRYGDPDESMYQNATRLVMLCCDQFGIDPDSVSLQRPPSFKAAPEERNPQA